MPVTTIRYQLTTIRNTRNWNNTKTRSCAIKHGSLIFLLRSCSPPPLLRWFYPFHLFFFSARSESSCVQVSRGRLLSHMLNLVTLPTGLYYARGLILIFRMAAMATRPSSTLISTFLSFAFPRDEEEVPGKHSTHSSRNFHELVIGYRRL